ncbi:MAG: amino acid adenylation domain-containing protein, partial [bacterium]|nr:amino acid adenylation domain-containing protein [bacterium]
MTTMKTKILQHKLDESFKEFVDNTAVEYGNQLIKYSELDEKVNHIVNWINREGIERESFIGIMAEDKLAFIYTLLALVKTGNVFVPLDTANPGDRFKKMVEISNTKTIFSDRDNHSLARDYFNRREDVRIVVIEEIIEEAGISDESASPVQYLPEDPIYIYFTSGSTGEPKAVLGKNASLLHYCRWEIDTLNVEHSFRISQFANTGFDAFLKEAFIAFLSGATLCIPVDIKEILNAEDLTRWVEESRINLLHCVPGVFSLLNSGASDENSFSELKYIGLSGEPTYPSELKNWYDKMGERIQLINLYGTTETTILKSYYFITKADTERKRIPIGKPIKGCRMIVLDEKMNVCNKGIVGEIYIRSNYNTLGYYEAPQLNEKKFVRNPFSDNPDDLIFKTGDLGRILLDENIELLGRVDRQVKIRGIRIELEEIENITAT